MLNKEKQADQIMYLLKECSYFLSDRKNINLLQDMQKHYIKYLRINNVMDNNWYKIKKSFISEFFYRKKFNDYKLLKKLFEELMEIYEIIDIDFNIKNDLHEDLEVLNKKIVNLSK